MTLRQTLARAVIVGAVALASPAMAQTSGYPETDDPSPPGGDPNCRLIELDEMAEAAVAASKKYGQSSFDFVAACGTEDAKVVIENDELTITSGDMDTFEARYHVNDDGSLTLETY